MKTSILSYNLTTARTGPDYPAYEGWRAAADNPIRTGLWFVRQPAQGTLDADGWVWADVYVDLANVSGAGRPHTRAGTVRMPMMRFDKIFVRYLTGHDGEDFAEEHAMFDAVRTSELTNLWGGTDPETEIREMLADDEGSSYISMTVKWLETLHDALTRLTAEFESRPRRAGRKPVVKAELKPELFQDDFVQDMEKLARKNVFTNFERIEVLRYKKRHGINKTGMHWQLQ